MVRYQVILAYDGTEFCGFQRQANARSVQGEVEAALLRIGWQGRSILAAGRTDTGVHASGQVIAFDLDWRHTPAELLAALNANLPSDVAARRVQEAKPGFHPRFDALSRRYRYQTFCQPVRDPLRERYAWRVWPPFDLARMQTAAAGLTGTHDFAAFGTPPRTGGSTIRTVAQAAWQPVPPDGWVFEITADAFLYRMVRHVVATLVAIGQGELPLDVIRASLSDHPQRLSLAGLAPAQGLALVEVTYPPDDLEREG